MRSRAAGFTLLEVVLAMTGVALISAICYGAFHVGLRAEAAGRKSVETAQRLRAASDVFTRQIRSVEPFPQDDDGFLHDAPYFDGTPTTLSFVTAAAQLGGGGLAQVTYRIEGDDPQTIVLEEVPFFSAYTVGTPGGESLLARRAVLLKDVEGASFKYYADDSGCSDGGEEGWCNVWSTSPNKGDQEFLPRAVRLYIKRVPGLDTDGWGQETPLAVASYYNDENRSVNTALSLERDDIDQEESGGSGDDE